MSLIIKCINKMISTFLLFYKSNPKIIVFSVISIVYHKLIGDIPDVDFTISIAKTLRTQFVDRL